MDAKCAWGPWVCLNQVHMKVLQLGSNETKFASWCIITKCLSHTGLSCQQLPWWTDTSQKVRNVSNMCNCASFLCMSQESHHSLQIHSRSNSWYFVGADVCCLSLPLIGRYLKYTYTCSMQNIHSVIGCAICKLQYQTCQFKKK